LIVKIIPRQERASSFVEPSLSPVPVEKSNVGQVGDSALTGSGDLREILPARRGEGRGEQPDPSFAREESGSARPDLETPGAPGAAFRLALEAGDGGEPGGVIVLAGNDLQPKGSSVARALHRPAIVLLAGKNIGIKIEQHGANIAIHQPLDDSRRTRGATRVQQ
jgi:hypothetical protein